jgi:hypothetical protein
MRGAWHCSLSRGACGAGNRGLSVEAFESALDIAHPRVRSAAFVQIVFQADARILRRLLKDEPRLGNDELAVHVLASATPLLPKALLAMAVQRTREMKHRFRPELLMTLASRFSGKHREALEQEAFKGASQVLQAQSTVWPLTLIAPDLPPALRTAALATALAFSRAIQSPRQRIDAVGSGRILKHRWCGYCPRVLADVRGMLEPVTGWICGTPFASSVLSELAADLPGKSPKP